MSDFDLDAAVAAARLRAAEVTNDGTATRLRIRETLARRPNARARRTAIVTAILASIFGSTAFAYYAGWRPPWTKHEDPPPAVSAVSTSEPRVPSKKQHAARPEPAVVEAVPPAELAPAEPAPPPAPAPTFTPRIAAVAPAHTVERVPPRHPAPAIEQAPLPIEPRVDAPAPAPVASPPPPSAPAADPELAAYRVAHEAHFRGGNPAAALAAWDAYLAAYPSGKLAVDARYSRALILIKLERWSDAKEALRPFASAPAGSYRQAEAAKLLAALPR